MADPRRVHRLEKTVLQTIAPMVSHGLKDPRLQMVTVTRIRLSADLSVARVNWSSLGSAGDRSKAAHALESARGPLQAAVGRHMQTRVTPRLEFHYDASAEKARKIHDILDRLALERAEKEGLAEDTDTEPDSGPAD